MALLKSKFNLLPHEKQCAEDLFARLIEIDEALQDLHQFWSALAENDEAFQDWCKSWAYCKRLLQEQAQIKDILRKLGYEP